MAKFEAGDRVRVRSDRGITWVDEMKQYCGTEQVICFCDCKNHHYELESCDGYYFDEEDLTLVEETDCIKDCENCKHFELDYDDFPCCECGYYENYERCDKPSEDKALKPKNYIAEFMADNGIDFNEEFEVGGVGELYKIKEDYKLWYNMTGKNSIPLINENFLRILKGEIQINKITDCVDDTCIGTDIEVSFDKKDGTNDFTLVDLKTGICAKMITRTNIRLHGNMQEE